MLVLGLCELQKKFPWTCIECRPQPHGVIDLVCASPGDVFPDALDGGIVGMTLFSGLPVQIYFDGIRWRKRDDARRRVKPKPEIGKPISCMRQKRRIKCRCGLVAEKAGCMPAVLFHQALNLRQRLRNILQLRHRDNPMRLGEIQPFIPVLQ